MTRDHFNNSIRTSRKVLKELGLLEGSVYEISLPRSAEFNKTCLTSRSYVEIYEKALSLSHYNLILTDLAFFQFTYKSPVEFALAFYPNPRITGSVDALSDYEDLIRQRNDDEIGEEEFSELVTLMPAEIYVPRMRYEFSKSQLRTVTHPGAHFHIGMSGEDRWSSERKLSPLSFLYLMVKYYYPNYWWPKSRFSGAEDLWNDAETIENCWDEKLSKSLRNDGTSHLFHDEERKSFHFSASYF
ncbi:DUF2290 domain-containing protein [Sulfitobacter sp. AS92]|uniref:DUF2290 domain-containing protein n=1 Tax=Sulfitobacter sp. AS92 TaxID=3135783 RepID=UPI00316C8861